MDTKTKISVPENISECPSPNQAVSENGIYMFRKIIANMTENVTVPISCDFPSKYAGIF